MAAGLVVSQSAQTSASNITKQAAYLQILSDIKGLVVNGEIPPNAVIASNATGIPLEWANPLTLDLPAVQYLDMGWFTNSPSFNNELLRDGIQSLPAGFYQNSNVYLMTRQNMMGGILQFIRDHEGFKVKVKTIYQMPNKSGDPVYDNVAIYKLYNPTAP